MKIMYSLVLFAALAAFNAYAGVSFSSISFERDEDKKFIATVNGQFEGCTVFGVKIKAGHTTVVECPTKKEPYRRYDISFDKKRSIFPGPLEVNYGFHVLRLTTNPDVGGNLNFNYH